MSNTDKYINTRIVTDFVQAINNSDVDGILDLITEDHEFIDSQDNIMTGKEKLKQAWDVYFTMFPDYKIEINEILEKGSLMCILGYASGTYTKQNIQDNNNYWRIPAAWSAVIKEDKVKQWQVYADNIPVMDIVKRNQ